MNVKEITILGSMAIGMFACGGNETKETKTEEVTEETTEIVEATTLAADLNNSVVNWRGEMVGGAYFHEGTAKLSEGALTMEGDAIAGGSFTVDLTSLAATDSNYSEEHTSEQLIGHLSADDFFDVANNPTATFVIKSVEGNTITGDFTVRGKTVEEQVEGVTITNDNGVVTASGKIVFDRQKHDVAYVNTMGDMVISDDIAIDITIRTKM